MPQYDRALFIFRRDLRLVDNTALNAALRASRQVIAGFIFDDRQINPHHYQSKPALHFMLQSLVDLQKELQAINAELNLFQGSPNQVITNTHQHFNIEAVFVNRDYTPFSRQRDSEMANLCQALGIAFYYLPDALLNEPEQALKADGSVYKVFTPYYNNARQRPVVLPQNLADGRFLKLASTITLANLAEIDSFQTTTLPGGWYGDILALGSAIGL